MCGIVAYIGTKDAYPILIKGLYRLEYRGYDSSGVAILDDQLSVYKTKGKVSELDKFVKDKNTIGLIGFAMRGPPGMCYSNTSIGVFIFNKLIELRNFTFCFIHA